MCARTYWVPEETKNDILSPNYAVSEPKPSTQTKTRDENFDKEHGSKVFYLI